MAKQRISSHDLGQLVFIVDLESEDEDGAPLFWSNEDGWVGMEGATPFTRDEVGRLMLPVGGKVAWMSLWQSADLAIRARQDLEYEEAWLAGEAAQELARGGVVTH